MSAYLNYDDVVAQLQSAGLILPAALVIGKRQRTHIEGKDSEKRGWYSLFEFRTDDGEYLISGAYGVWHGNDNGKCKIELSEHGKKISAEQMAANRERIKAEQKRAEAEEKAKQARAAAEAAAMWARLNHEGECEYLRRKGVAGHGVRYTAQGNMALPLYDERGAIHGLQVIYADKAKNKKGRDKDFWPAGVAKKGHWFQIGMPDWIALIAEGYATAASLHEATGLPVIVAFDAGNLLPVAQAIHKRYPRAKLLICADDDYASAGNPGITAANAAAVAVSGSWVAPEFAAERPAHKGGPTDFNDLHALEGLHIVRQQIEAKLTELGWRRRDLAAPDAESGGGVAALLGIDGAESLLRRFSLIYGANGVAFDHQERVLVKLSDVRDACLNKNFVRDWQADSRRRIVRMHEVGFDPTESDPSIKCNMWAGWPTVPRQGRCEKLLEILYYMAAREDNCDEVYLWMLRWLAYPIQHPGAKLKTAMIVHGPQGGGKNLFFEAVRDIYGEYGSTIGQDALEDKHNDWAGKKMFLIADEVIARQEMHHIKNKLKGMVTSDRLRINPKHVTAHEETNHVNIVFLSNEAMPLVLEKDDRRHLVVWMPPSMPEGYYSGALEEIRSGGVAALHHYLLNLDLGEFHPGSRPPMTQAKETLIQSGRDSADAFMDEWIAGDIDVPKVPAPIDSVYRLYKRWAERNGYRYIHTKDQFSTRAEKVPGVTKRLRLQYLASQTIKQAGFLFPPDYEQQGNLSQKEWLTACFDRFETMAKEWH